MINYFPETNFPSGCNLSMNSGFNYENQSFMENLDGEKKMNILIADDDPDDRELLSDALFEISNNFQITMVENGKELMVELVGEELYDLIFLDLNMPAMNGFECLEKIKADPKRRELPVLIYSTSANPDQIEQTYLQGALFYIQKPSNFYEIRDVMKKLLGFPMEMFLIQPARKDFLLKI